MALEHISELFLKHFPYSDLKEHLEQDHRVRLDQLVGSIPSFLVDKLSKDYKYILIVYPDAESAEFLQSDLHELENHNPLYFPPTHHKPYDEDQVVDTNIMVQRSEVLEKILDSDRYVVATSAPALFEKIASSEAFNESSLLVENGDQIQPENLRKKLNDQGYKNVKFVERPGEFATRGGIVDVFPYSSEYPVRIEFFGDEIDSIREFDPDSQRSIAYLNAARFVPDIQDFGDDDTESLVHYLDEDTVVLLANYSLIQSELEVHFEKAQKAYQHLEDKSDHSPPSDLFLAGDEFESMINNQPQIYLGSFSQEVPIDWQYPLEANPQPEFNASFKLLRQNVKKLSKQNYDIFILCDSEGQRERFEELPGEYTHENRYHLSIETLHRGLILKDPGIAV
jgi:transcription-repair coupling factor (superfamily II helicase)